MHELGAICEILWVILMKKESVMVPVADNSSTLEKIVEKLRTMDEGELKLEYIRLFKDDLNRDWGSLTTGSDIEDITDEEIVAIIQKKRYPPSDGKNNP